jgi:hypothetical protein
VDVRWLRNLATVPGIVTGLLPNLACHRYGPFVLGLAAAATLLAGKFAWESPVMTYGGIVVLIVASIWNSWPRRASTAPCPGCNTADNSLVQT